MYGSSGRFRVRIVGRAALIAAVVSAVCGCAAPRNHLYRRSGADFERALVLPLNLVAAMPKELAGRANRVDEALLGYFAERGKAVEAIGFADASTAWRASEAECRSQAGKGCDRFEGVARFMARHLRTDHDYQILIIPYLFLRTARCGSNECRWHGVKRLVEKSGSGFDPGGYARLVRGDVRAASLKVFAFSADGEKVFDGVGGLDLVDRVSADDDGFYNADVREDVLGDPEMLREGVELALERLVPRSHDTGG